jgi:hypothetical protein
MRLLVSLLCSVLLMLHTPQVLSSVAMEASSSARRCVKSQKLCWRFTMHISGHTIEGGIPINYESLLHLQSLV